jgi:predicted ATPase with chaperone activity
MSVRATQVQKYRNRLSGLLMDRIDIHVKVPAMELKDMTGTSTKNLPLPSGNGSLWLASSN